MRFTVQWQRTIAGYIVDVIEPIAMFAVIGLALAFRSRSRATHRKRFEIVDIQISPLMTSARR